MPHCQCAIANLNSNLSKFAIGDMRVVVLEAGGVWSGGLVNLEFQLKILQFNFEVAIGRFSLDLKV